MAQAGLSQMPDDLVAAIVLRAFGSSGATLQARLNIGLVCRRGALQLLTDSSWSGQVCSPQPPHNVSSPAINKRQSRSKAPT